MSDPTLLRCEDCGEIRPLTVDCAACGKADGRVISGGDLYPVSVCARCVAGLGGECHTPGCAFWMMDAPDGRLRVMEGVVPMNSAFQVRRHTREDHSPK